MINTKGLLVQHWGRRLLPLLTILLLSSCAAVGKYSPDPALADGVVDGIDIKTQLRLTNAQPSTQEHNLGFRGIIINYHTFTQSLVDAVKMEYQRNKVSVNDSAEKELKIKVTQVTMGHGGFNFRAYIYAEVEFGDNTVEKFQATDASYGSPLMVNHFPTKPLDSAFKYLVGKIIYSTKIKDYLNN